MDEEKQILTVKEAAELLSIHPVTLRRLASQGKIPCQKIGGQWRFDRNAIRDYVVWFRR